MEQTGPCFLDQTPLWEGINDLQSARMFELPDQRINSSCPPWKVYEFKMVDPTEAGHLTLSFPFSTSSGSKIDG